MHTHSTLSACHQNRLPAGYLLIFVAGIETVYVASHQLLIIAERPLANTHPPGKHWETTANQIAEENGRKAEKHSKSPCGRMMVYKLV